MTVAVEEGGGEGAHDGGGFSLRDLLVGVDVVKQVATRAYLHDDVDVLMQMNGRRGGGGGRGGGCGRKRGQSGRIGTNEVEEHHVDLGTCGHVIQ